ncbi:MAG: hypothetical protein A2V52_03300 [Actinobacteria bacterium RBG_19FT_COMBO_54_7]|uniref:Histidine kinase/HSP90-like ATPase domain-containing protein n=1 Tax=Candidatus Solincola sediminis TaxID=1797199 RepID=A0A1F2WGH4_9ACTN|nr:MAG: hypothetical protein A2Y75_04290 [Candidatus Solincola sediminis]OFW56236.1 MAG: hypothetical protein A2W01_05750 [Candidatus Solincola sediminis]OFW70493.1 MAG: hypothetical protein A2V52_03300 [Actinobacteria bacterium RBG_19FT_COMBO_54_7]
MSDTGKDREALLTFVHKFADTETLAIEEELGHGYVRLKVTEAERRQALQDVRCVEDVVKELVRNARDAKAEKIYVTFQKEKGRWRNITVLDNGSGIPPELHRKIFEARVTSKVKGVVEDPFGVHGRGMALYSIRHVAEEISLVKSIEDRGTIVQVRIDTEKLPEKKDQSSMPRLDKNDDGGTTITGGAHNVPRVLAEFSLGPGPAELFFGSNAEILATLYYHSLELRKQWAAGKNNIRKPMWFELGGLKEGKALHQFARDGLGLSVSERNAFRILEYEIQPLISINDLFRQDSFSLPARRADLHTRPKASWGDHLARRINQDDLSSLCTSLKKTFEDIGERCYLEAEAPVVKRRKNRLIISLGLREKDED